MPTEKIIIACIVIALAGMAWFYWYRPATKNVAQEEISREMPINPSTGNPLARVTYEFSEDSTGSQKRLYSIRFVNGTNRASITITDNQKESIIGCIAITQDKIITFSFDQYAPGTEVFQQFNSGDILLELENIKDGVFSATWKTLKPLHQAAEPTLFTRQERFNVQY